jgi:SAM-dependent methyltransferase
MLALGYGAPEFPVSPCTPPACRLIRFMPGDRRLATPRMRACGTIFDVHEILSVLPPGSMVLDLGSGSGSFDAGTLPFTVVRADIEVPRNRKGNLVICGAWHLPFKDRSFQALILNHSLEHFENVSDCVREMGRVLAEDGLLYIAVPDASTVTDHVYRWLARGGGHVNLFSHVTAVPHLVSEATGLKHAGTRTLCTSLSFLNRKNMTSRAPRKLVLFCYGNEDFLRLLTFVFRKIDRLLGWRSSVYGWAFYFGDMPAPDADAWSNVCIRCGSGHRSARLKDSGSVRKRRFLPATYMCPQCKTKNFFTDDDELRHLRSAPAILSR